MAAPANSSSGSVLVPVKLDQSPAQTADTRHEIAGSTRVSRTILESLAPAEVVLLGYWPVPDQSSPQQLRDQFEAEASERLAGIEHSLADEAFDTIAELSFSKDRDHLIDRVANNHGCQSVLLPGVVRSRPPESVLVLVKSDSDLDRIVETVGTLFADGSVDILLFHAVERGDDPTSTEYMLHGIADRLTERGIDPERIRWERSDRGSRVDTIVSEVSDHDLVVLSESEPSVRERLFGPIQSGITDRTDRPSLTVRAGT